jgi:hypothetical protein
MKCPKCHYVSHDYLDACRKCGIDLMAFKHDLGLLVLQPGVLDLSLVLAGAGADDLFESMDEDVTMHPSDDDDFDLSLDDYAAQPGIRRAPAGAPRPGGRETEDDLAGMDHLTLELDASDLPADVAAHLRAVQVIPGAPPTPPTPTALPPAGPRALPLPEHVTVEMESESMSTAFPPGAFQEAASVAPPPPPQGMPEITGPQEITSSLQLDVSHIDFGPMPPSAHIPEAESLDEVGAESTDEAVSVVDFSGAIASLQLQDVVLADDTLAAPEDPEPEVAELTLPTIELVEVDTTFAQMDAERRTASEEAAEAASTVANSRAFSIDDSALTIEADELSGRALSDVIEPALTTLDEPPLEDMGLLPSLEFELDTLAEAESTLADPAAPTLDEAPLTFADEDVPRTPPSRALTPPVAELTPEDALTLADMFALEDLEATMLPGHLTLEMSAPALPPELASYFEDVTRTPPRDAPETTEASPSAGADPGFPAAEALPLGNFDDSVLPEYLTLELDASEMTSNVSSILLNNLQLDDLPGDAQSKMSPPGDQGDEEEELLLDLEDLEFDDDKPK